MGFAGRELMSSEKGECQGRAAGLVEWIRTWKKGVAQIRAMGLCFEVAYPGLMAIDVETEVGGNPSQPEATGTVRYCGEATSPQEIITPL